MGRPKMPSGEAGKPQPKDTDSFPTAEVGQDKMHSINDDFGFPLWSQYFDESKDGNTQGQVEPVDTDHDFYADWQGKEYRNLQTYPPFPAKANNKYSEETSRSGQSSVSQNVTHNHADDEDASGGGDDSEG